MKAVYKVLHHAHVHIFTKRKWLLQKSMSLHVETAMSKNISSLHFSQQLHDDDTIWNGMLKQIAMEQ